MLGFRSIRLRLTLWYVLLLAIILAGFSAGIYLTLRHNLYANLDDSLETRANDLEAAGALRGRVVRRCPRASPQTVPIWGSSSSVSTTLRAVDLR